MPADFGDIVRLLDWEHSAHVQPWLSPISEGASQGVAVVLGQSLKPDGTPAQILKGRALAAKALLDEGKATKVIVTGADPAAVGHTEASEMKRVLEDAGIPAASIIQ